LTTACTLSFRLFEISIPNSDLKGLKGLDIYIPPLTGKPEHQQFTVRSGILSSINSGQCSATGSRPLPEQTDFWTHSLEGWKAELA